MNKYELTVVVNAKIEDDERAQVIEKVKDLVTRFGGNVTDVDEWGKRRLAYEIQKMKEAYYYFIHFESDATVPGEVEERIRIMDTLAVDRRFRRNNDGEQTADFIGCVAFGRSAEFAEKYFRQGLKVIVTGRIQTGSYTNKDGQRVYTTDVVVEDQEFAESKAASESHMNGGFQAAPAPAPSAPAGDGFMNIPDGIDEELPFN